MQANLINHLHILQFIITQFILYLKFYQIFHVNCIIIGVLLTIYHILNLLCLCNFDVYEK